MVNKLKLSCIVLLYINLMSTHSIAQSSTIDKVDMFMGTLGNSHCVIGPQLPHGSVNPSPQTPNGSHGGYKQGQPVRGFGQLHVSGTGWGRYGQIFISPQTGFNPKEDGHDSSISKEIATPYYYAANLDRYNIFTEITPTHNCVFYKITFPKNKDSNILLDIAHNLPQHIVPEVKGKFLGGEINYDEQNNTLDGWGEYTGGFGSKEPYKVYYTLVLDTKLKTIKIKNDGTKALYAQLSLPSATTIVNMKIGISLKSVENARQFLSNEIGIQSFEDIKDKGKKIWENILSHIDVKGGTDEEQCLLYTGLYHSFVMPRDRTGDNPNWESNMPHLDDHYCVWDTWRTKYPLMILLQQSYVANTINSFIDRFAHNGVCNPTFTSSLDWEEKQGGDDVDNIIADAILKGVDGFDYNKAYQLIKWNAFNARSKDYLRIGWQPENGERMGCSYNMEFAYNDYCTFQIAEKQGDQSTADMLRKRSNNWDKLFNKELESRNFKGFIAPRKENGEWIQIDPTQVYGSWVEYFYEGNSWVYTLFTPHQFDRLIDFCGGQNEMIKRLTYGFDNKLIDLSNEPGFLAPFIFSHCNRPDLTAKYVSKIRKNSFSLQTGYPDNEDSGAMGSWYAFTSIGLFPNAGQDLYYLLPPAFREVEVTMENGKKINIKTIKTNTEACYIESVSINGKVLNRPWIYHREIAEGATIIYTLTDKENKWIVNQ